ncbi:MAG: hypothetical protein ACK55I_30090 [bacterium]
MKNNPKQGQLFLTITTWDAFHVMKNPHGIWVPKQEENTYLIHPQSRIIKSIIPPETPAMYIGTDGRPHVGVFLVADTFLELPYNILKEIKQTDDNS